MLLVQGITLILLSATISSEVVENANKLQESDALCDAICVESGISAEYDPESGTCKCTLDENLDDTDKELLNKNARLHNVETTTPKSSVLIKREIESQSETVGQQPSRFSSMRNNKQSTPRTINLFATSTTKRSQRPTIRTAANTPTANRRFSNVFSTRRPGVPSFSDAQKRIQEIQKQINDQLRNRARNVPNFQQRANNGDQTAANILEQIRKRQKEFQERMRNSMHLEQGEGRRLGAEHIVEKENQKSRKNKGSESNLKNTEIITQPPNLYE